MKQKYEQPVLTVVAIGNDVIITSEVACAGQNELYVDSDPD